MAGRGDRSSRRASQRSACAEPVAHPARPGRVTWKSTEAVVDLLRRCGASASVLELESRLVTRQLHGHLNRVLNAETANLRRSVASSVRQLATIEGSRRAGAGRPACRSNSASPQERRAAPEATFSELADRLDVSRAGIQRAFRRMDAAVAVRHAPAAGRSVSARPVASHEGPVAT